MNRSSFESWPEVFRALAARRDLEPELARDAMAAILDGQATEAQIGAFLVGLSGKGESTAEVLAMRDAMLDSCTPLALPDETVDIVGVGGAPRRQVAAFNVSTIASVIAASAGATICKHGNRKASSTSGSFDLLEALGVRTDISPDAVAASVTELGLGFAFARAHHPAMRHVGPARSQLGVPTVFNVLGPLSHPGRVRRQVLGVPDAPRAAQVADVVQGMRPDRVWVVHGHEDLDELTITGPASVVELVGDARTETVVNPAELGLSCEDTEQIRGGDAETNAAITREILAGTPSANRDMVVLNAGAALVVAGCAEDLSEGTSMAAAAIDDGRAAAKLDALVALTNA